MQLGLSTGVAADLGMGWNLETSSRQDKCSSERRNARPNVLEKLEKLDKLDKMCRTSDEN